VRSLLVQTMFYKTSGSHGPGVWMDFQGRSASVATQKKTIHKQEIESRLVFLPATRPGTNRFIVT